MNEIQSAIVASAFTDEFEKIAAARGVSSYEVFEKVANAQIAEMDGLEKVAHAVFPNQYPDAELQEKIAMLLFLADELGDEEAHEKLAGLWSGVKALGTKVVGGVKSVGKKLFGSGGKAVQMAKKKPAPLVDFTGKGPLPGKGALGGGKFLQSSGNTRAGRTY